MAEQNTNKKLLDNNFTTIQGWMINKLNLKGNDLLVYAVIYGFSQTEGTRFTGSLQYLAEWVNSTKTGVAKNIKSLVEKGYIVKVDKYDNGVKYCEYYATKLESIQQSEQNNRVTRGRTTELHEGIQQSCTNNNIIINNNNKIKEDKKSFTNFEEFRTKENKDIEPSVFTKKLIRSKYIDKEDLDIIDYNELIDYLIHENGHTIVNSALNYFCKGNKFRKNKDENFNEIQNKYSYFKTSIESGIDRLHRINNSPLSYI